MKEGVWMKKITLFEDGRGNNAILQLDETGALWFEIEVSNGKKAAINLRQNDRGGGIIDTALKDFCHNLGLCEKVEKDH